jgi:hypothetical protein
MTYRYRVTYTGRLGIASFVVRVTGANEAARRSAAARQFREAKGPQARILGIAAMRP